MLFFRLLLMFTALTCPAFAGGGEEEFFVLQGCGQSEAAAYHFASLELEERRFAQEQECAEISGRFFSRSARGTCIYHDGYISCPVECTMYLRTQCETEESK